MAGYTYAYRSSSAGNSLKPDDWNKPSNVSEHVCRPVIIDAEGRKHPIVSYGPTQTSDYYVTTTTETIVEENILSPGGYRVVEESWQRPSSPVHNRPQESWKWPSSPVHNRPQESWQRPSSPVHDRPPKVDEFFTKVQNEASRPKFTPISPSTWHQTAKPTGFPGKTGSYGSEFNEHSRNEWEKPIGNNNYEYGKTHSKNEWEKPIGNNNYDYGKNHSKNEWEKPIGNNNYDYGKHHSSTEPWSKPTQTWGTPPNSVHSRPTYGTNIDTSYFKEPVKPHSSTTTPASRYPEPAYKETTEPTMITNGGWARPSSAGWASPPNSNLSKPTSDINTAMGILKEAAKPSVYTSPSPGYNETIDSREASKRYGNFFSTRPYATEDKYTTTIDSREAARRYNGAIV